MHLLNCQVRLYYLSRIKVKKTDTHTGSLFMCQPATSHCYCAAHVAVSREGCINTGWHKKPELLKNPPKIEEFQEKKFIDRNWTITTCILRDSNPNYQCLKITSCRRRPPRMRSFTATKHFKSSHSFVSPCVCCMLCRACNAHRRTPTTGRNFQTLIIWITVS